MSSDKVVAAREWGDAIHVVRVEWLLACVREWRRVSEKEFEVKDVNEDDVETGDDELEGNVEKEKEEEVETEDDKKKEEITGTQANTKLSQKRILSLPPNTKKANTTAIP